MSHLVIHRVPGWPADPAPLAPWQLAVLAGAYLLVLLYLVGTFRGRTPYDALAGVRVVRRPPPA